MEKLLCLRSPVNFRSFKIGTWDIINACHQNDQRFPECLPNGNENNDRHGKFHFTEKGYRFAVYQTDQIGNITYRGIQNQVE